MSASELARLTRERNERLLWRAAHEGELTTDDVMGLFGVQRNAAAKRLERAVKNGVLKRTSTGNYAQGKAKP